jgi:putative ABC transport system permease protein
VRTIKLIEQTCAVALVNLRALRLRKAASIVTLGGIAGAVLVVVSLLSMAQGLEATLRTSGRADRVLILRAGSNSELNGAITHEQVAIVADKPGLEIASGRTAISGEIYTSVFLPRREGRNANLTLRGVTPTAFLVRPEIRIVQGRFAEPGRFELIVGKRAAQEFANLAPGRSISVRGTTWQIVGVFAASGSVFESEAWADASIVAAAFKRGAFLSSITATLRNEADFATFQNAIAQDPRLQLHVWRENEYYAREAADSTATIKVVVAIIGGIMGLGAIFAALNTMYAAVSARTAEIATLKALGFSSTPIVGSVLIESLVLAFTGGVIGGVAAWALFDGYSASTLGATFAQVAFEFKVAPHLILAGIGFACALGLIGGLLPAARAARLPVVAGLRG